MNSIGGPPPFRSVQEKVLFFFGILAHFLIQFFFLRKSEGGCVVPLPDPGFGTPGPKKANQCKKPPFGSRKNFFLHKVRPKWRGAKVKGPPRNFGKIRQKICLQTRGGPGPTRPLVGPQICLKPNVFEKKTRKKRQNRKTRPPGPRPVPPQWRVAREKVSPAAPPPVHPPPLPFFVKIFAGFFFFPRPLRQKRKKKTKQIRANPSSPGFPPPFLVVRSPKWGPRFQKRPQGPFCPPPLF